MIELIDVSFAYPDSKPGQSLIDHANLAFAKGHITTVIGPNGCGKSTLLKLCTKLLNPTGGKILLGKTDLTQIRPKNFARHVAVLGQNNALPQMLVKDYVVSGRYPYSPLLGSFSKNDWAWADHAMQMAGCYDFRNQEVGRLSGGERQRVYIAMALAQDTELIFLDEPTTYLDIHICFEIMDLIKRLNQEFAKTIVMILHDLNLALNYSEQIVLMQAGQIIAHQPAAEIALGNELSQVFNVSSQCFTANGKQYFCFDKV